ncbi:extracellular solute-binding protein [Paenibacillus thalictri]|nr:extracellular solute-binding protein [Paenibacillus thalictri]
MKASQIGKPVLCSALVCVLALSACSNQNESANSKGGANSNAAADPKAAGKPVTIKFHTWWDAKNERLEPMISEFEKLNPGIKVEPIRLEGKDAYETLKKLDLLAASGETLDVIMFNNPTSYAQRVGMGMAEPLDSYLKAEGVKYDDEYSNDTSIKGVHYALPGTWMPDVVILNKDHLAKAGLPVPKEWTFDEFLEYSKKLTKVAGDDQYGTYFHNWEPSFNIALRNQPANSLMISEDGKLNVSSPGVRKSLEIVYNAQMRDKSAMPYSDVISRKLHYAWPYFNAKASMQILGGYMIGRVGGYDMYEAKFPTAFAPYPKMNKGDENYAPVSETQYLAVAASSKHKEEAYKFIRYYSTEGFGVQGRFINAWKKQDVGKNIDKIVSLTPKPNMIDAESFKNVMSVSKMVKLQAPPTYYNEIVQAYTEEMELYLLGKQDLDKTIKKVEEKAQKIKELNK